MKNFRTPGLSESVRKRPQRVHPLDGKEETAFIVVVDERLSLSVIGVQSLTNDIFLVVGALNEIGTAGIAFTVDFGRHGDFMEHGAAGTAAESSDDAGDEFFVGDIDEDDGVNFFTGRFEGVGLCDRPGIPVEEVSVIFGGESLGDNTIDEFIGNELPRRNIGISFLSEFRPFAAGSAEHVAGGNMRDGHRGREGFSLSSFTAARRPHKNDTSFHYLNTLSHWAAAVIRTRNDAAARIRRFCANADDWTGH